MNSPNKDIDTRIHDLKNKLREHKRSRQKVSDLVENIANNLNKKTYFTTEKLHASLGSAVKPSLLCQQLDNELFDAFVKLEATQKLQEEQLKALARLIEISSDDLPVEASALKTILSQLERQLLLEISVSSALMSYEEHPAAQDDLVAMVACFRFSPYIKESDLEHLLSI
jgi:hypothetical protein